MSFILDENTENVPELKTLPSGSEVEIRILKVEMKNAKSSGAPMLAIQFDIPEEPTSKDIFHNIMLPQPQDDEKKRVGKLNRLKEFKACFGLSQSGPLSSDDLEGVRGWAILEEEEGQNGDLQNRVKKFVVGA